MVENILAAQEGTAICISIQLVPPKTPAEMTPFEA